MSNAESSPLAVPIEPRALLRVEALPSERHPAAVYLASLGSGSRRTMRQSLGVIAQVVSGGRADIRSLAWEKLRYQHTQRFVPRSPKNTVRERRTRCWLLSVAS